MSVPANNGFLHQTVSFYDACAEHYDFLYPDHNKFSKRLARRILPKLKEMGVRKILDASCGVGHDIAIYTDLGFDVDGIDISPSMVEKTIRRLSSCGFLKKPRIVCADAQNAPSVVETEAYDLVLFRGNSLSNIRPSQWRSLLENLTKVLRPGGAILLDYRDGHEQFNEKKPFEFRGRGLHIPTSSLFVSYYELEHAESIYEPYQVSATVKWFSLRLSPRRGVARFSIESHYVIEADVFSAAKELGFEPSDALNNHDGLPYLSTRLFSRT